MAGDCGHDRAVLNTLFDGVFFVDRQQRVTYWNAGAERITGHSAERVVGHECPDDLLRPVGTDGIEFRHGTWPLAEAMADGRARETELFIHHADGHRVRVLVRDIPLRDDQGNTVGGAEVLSDNAALIAARQRMEVCSEAAAVDPLTGVNTRECVESRIRMALEASGPHDPALGVLVADVDRFRHINARLGREAADNVLKLVADTIRRNVRSSDVVGRWGADEFVVAVLGVDRTRMIMIANKLRAAVERAPVVLGRGEGHVTVSIGATIAHAPDTAETVLRRAEDLLWASRTSGRDEVRFAD